MCITLASSARAALSNVETIAPGGFARGVVLTVDGYADDEDRATLTNFPVLVRVSNETIPGFSYSDINFPAKANADICFVAEDGTPLAFDIDTWDMSANATSLVWVTLPTMTNGTEFAMFYKGQTSGKDVCGGNAFTNYVGVWHLGETGDAAQVINDSTLNELTGDSSSRSLAVPAGRIGAARTITNQRDKKNFGITIRKNDDSLAALDTLGTSFVVSLWMRPLGAVTDQDAGIRYDELIGRKPATGTRAWQLQLADKSNNMRIWSNETSDGDVTVIGQVLPLVQNQWTKLDVVYAPSGYQVFANGSSVASGTYKKGNAPAQGSDTLSIGSQPTGNERSFWGDMDEVRLGQFDETVTGGAGSADWVKADYDQATNTLFLSASAITSIAVVAKPLATLELADSGAAYAQFAGQINGLGGDSATACFIRAKAWPTGTKEPAAWTTIASGLALNDTFSGVLVDLRPQTPYDFKIQAVNDITEESDITTGTFTTSGAGEIGSGGDMKRVGDSMVHTFRIAEDGTAAFEFVPPSYATSVEALVVAGGGAGGFRRGGGGGAGGLLHYDAFPVTGGATYDIAVGAGGAAATTYTYFGGDGLPSSISSNGVTLITTVGGGAGGNGDPSCGAAMCNGRDGGSGGGSGAKANTDTNAGTGVNGQGYAGGTGRTDANYANNKWGGGGGGANATGGSVAQSGTCSGGNGGDGKSCSISGEDLYYAGGGGGGGEYSQSGSTTAGASSGGKGGGGHGGQKSDTNGSNGSAVAESGKAGTGGGGGGGSNEEGSYQGGDGGSGIVIFRYPIEGDGTGEPAPAIALTSATYDAEHSEVSFTYRVAWAGYGYQFADVGIAWGYSPDALTTTNGVATDKIGIGSGTVTLPNVSKTVYLRAVATNAGGHVDDSVETAVFTLFNPDAPVGSISLSSAAVTNATFAVEVTDFGTDASSASVRVEVCASEDFTGTILSFPAAAALSATGTVSVAATGLARNSSYYARAIVVNNRNVELTTDAIEFSTMAPGAPVGKVTATDVGFTKLSVTARVTSFGSNASAAKVRLEVSTVADFTTLLATSAETAASLNSNIALMVSGLDPDTHYYWRVRIRNDWDVDTYIVLPFTSTHPVPFAASGPSWTSTGDTIAIKLAVSAVYDGAECSATLTYGGEAMGTRTFDAPGDVTWGGLAAKADGTVARIVVTATVDGTDYVRTFSVPVTPSAGATAVTDVSPYCSAAGALWMRPGDIATLPDLYGDASYQVLNERFATIKGSMLTALEPGIVGVRCVDASFNTSIMGVVILPDAIGSGSVYVFKETAHNNTCDWSRPECWDKVENGARAASNDSFPQNADDIAILPFHAKTGDISVRHSDDITVGGLYCGNVRPDVKLNCVLERYNEGATKTVTFRRTDGGTVEIKICPNNDTSGNSSSIQFGNVNINVVWSGSILIDCCSSETDVNGPCGLVKYKDSIVITNTAENATITVQGLPGYNVNGPNGTTKFNGVWKGAVEFVKKGQGSLALPEDVSGLSGVIRDMTGPTIGDLGAPAAGVLMRAAGASNMTAHVYGYASYKRDTGAMSYNGLSCGTLGTGGASVGPTGGAQGPAKGLHLHGGTYRANQIDNTSWGVGVKDEKAFDVLSVGAGLSYLTLQAPNSNSGGKPINAVTAKTLAQTNKGTLAIYDPSLNSNARQTVTNNMFTVLDWADHAIGGTGYGENGAAGASQDFAIVPWLVANGDSNYSYLQLPAIDANGRLVKPVRTASHIDQASGENANAICSDGYGSLTHGGAAEIVLNSLFLNNSAKGDQWLSSFRTLTIKSGGLILQKGSAIGLHGRNDNGKLVLGDATHPAYVWNLCWGSETNQIWSAVTAPGGFVSTYTGNLILGGVQTNIAEEIVVNSGTLSLGSDAGDCVLAKMLPVRVCAGATLLLPQSGTIMRNPLYVDGAAGAFGKVDLTHDQRAAELHVRDVYESNNWTELRRGTYGSSDSSAVNVRDDIFTGTGVLTVKPYNAPTFLIFN